MDRNSMTTKSDGYNSKDRLCYREMLETALIGQMPAFEPLERVFDHLERAQ